MGGNENSVQALLPLSNDGFISVSDPVAGTRNIRESVVVMSSGDMSGLNGLDVNGTSQISFETSFAGASAIRVQGVGVASGIDVDVTGILDFTSSNTNTQAVRFLASDSAGGIIFTAGQGGIEQTTTGNIDYHTSVDQSGQGIQIRTTGTQGEIQLYAGTGGVRIMDSTGLFIEDESSAFSQQLVMPTIAGDIQWTFPDAQGGTDTILSNNGSGLLSWVAPSGASPDATGVIAGGFLTINGGDSTQFDVSNGTGIIYNTTTKVKTTVTWTGLTGQSTTYVGDSTFISINAAGAVVFSTTLPTNTEIRDNIYLGQVAHLDQINIIATLDEQMTLLSGENQIRDFMEAIGELKISGNVVMSNSLLTIAKTAGTILKFGGNFENDINNPHLPTSGTLDTNVANTFAYRWKDGTTRLSLTDIVPNEYDDGNGETSPGTVPANQWTVQRIFTFSIGGMFIQQGQFLYGTKAEAIAAVSTEGFVIDADLAITGILIAFLAVKGNTTDLSTIANAEFFQAGKFGGATSGAGGDASTDIAASTSNRVCVFADASGKLLTQDSSVVINAGAVSGVDSLAIDGATSGAATISAPAVAGSVSFVLPPTEGSADDVLRTDGSGVTTWVAQSGGSALPTKYVEGLIVSDSTTSIKDISVGSCRSDDNTLDIVSAGVLSLNITSSGANGLDTGSEASNTWYAIYVIGGGGNATASLLSVSATSPTLPGTYTVQRRIGWVRNDGSSNFYEYDTQSTGRDRFVLWNEVETILELLTNGGATTYTNVDISELIPPTCTTAYINANHVSNDGGQEFVTFRTAGLAGTGPRAHRVFAGSANSAEASASTCFFIRTDSTQNIEYRNSSGSEQTDIWVLGYTDSI